MRIHLGDKTRLILAALAVAIATIVGIVVVADFVPARYTNISQAKWMRFGIVSVGFVGYGIKAYWKLRRSLAFWSILLTFLLIHLLGTGYFFYVGEGLPLLVFGPASAVELMGMALVIYGVLGVGPGNVSINL